MSYHRCHWYEYKNSLNIVHIRFTLRKWCNRICFPSAAAAAAATCHIRYMYVCMYNVRNGIRFVIFRLFFLSTFYLLRDAFHHQYFISATGWFNTKCDAFVLVQETILWLRVKQSTIHLTIWYLALRSNKSSFHHHFSHWFNHSVNEKVRKQAENGCKKDECLCDKIEGILWNQILKVKWLNLYYCYECHSEQTEEIELDQAQYAHFHMKCEKTAKKYCSNFIGQCVSPLDFIRKAGDFLQIKMIQWILFMKQVQHCSILYDNFLSKWCENTKHFKI